MCVIHFIVESSCWSLLDNKTSGSRPDVRMGHAAVYDPTFRCVYVHGGSKNLRWFSDVHILDVDEWQWQAVEVSMWLLPDGVHVRC